MRKFFATFLILILALLQLEARTVYVARHAQTGEGIKEIKETNISDELGVLQAQKLAKFLVKKLNFKGDVYASPFFRTTKTATYTAALLNKKVILEPGLQEMAPHKKPSPPGMNLKQIESYFPGKTTPSKRYAEGWRLCKEDNKMRLVRVEKAVDAILAETKGDVLLVTHGACVGDLMKIFKARSVSKKIKPVKGTAWNCALYVYEIDDNNKFTGGRYTTEYMLDSELTSNWRCPKIERPNDPRYMTAAQDKADRAKRAQKKAKSAKK